MHVHWRAVLRAVGRRHLGCQIRGVDDDLSRHRGIAVTLPALRIAHLYAGLREPVASGIVGGDQAALGAELHRHVGEHHAFVHGHGRHAAAGVLGGHVAGAVDADGVAEKKHHVLGRHSFAENAVQPHAQCFGYAHPDTSGGENARHVGGADAGHEAAEGTAGGGVGVAADHEHPRMEMTALGKHHVTDPLRFVIAAQRPFCRPVPGQRLYLHAVAIGLADEVVGDEHDLVRVPDIDTELRELRREAPRAAGVVHHGEVDTTGDDLARPEVLAPGGSGNNLLCQGHGHAGGCVVLAGTHYNRIVSNCSPPVPPGVVLDPRFGLLSMANG